MEPKWRQVAEAVASRITAGTWPVGTRIPAPPDLVAEFDCDRNTIREAYAFLAEVGVLEPRQGSGTFVRAVPPVPLPARRRVSPLERRISERLDVIERRIDRLERERD